MEKMKNIMGARKETGPQVSQKKHRRSRKPKFELDKPRKVNDKKKKDKRKNHIVAIQIANLGLEEFPLIFAQIRARNRRQRELNTEIDGYVLDKLVTWDAEDKLKLSTI
ncbi:hypothetical protein CRYUN_Cryun39dG0073200 [Craigia yunnanensis]